MESPATRLSRSEHHPGGNFEANLTFLQVLGRIPVGVDLRKVRFACELPPGWVMGERRVPPPVGALLPPQPTPAQVTVFHRRFQGKHFPDDSSVGISPPIPGVWFQKFEVTVGALSRANSGVVFGVIQSESRPPHAREKKGVERFQTHF